MSLVAKKLQLVKNCSFNNEPTNIYRNKEKIFFNRNIPHPLSKGDNGIYFLITSSVIITFNQHFVNNYQTLKSNSKFNLRQVGF